MKEVGARKHNQLPATYDLEYPVCKARNQRRVATGGPRSAEALKQLRQGKRLA